MDPSRAQPLTPYHDGIVETFLGRIPADRLERFSPDPGGSYILGCSGGLDSSLLAVLYAHLFRRGRLTRPPVLFHLNHRLRLSAYRDERFVEELGRFLDLPVYTERCRVGRLARRMRLNLEEAGRLVRYRKMDDLRGEMDAPVYAVTAHHADDFVETMLLKILRGATENAFRMPDLVDLEVRRGRSHLSVLRPLLFLDRWTLNRLADDLCLKFREDPSNRSSRFKRNRLRESVVPFLREEGLNASALWLRANGSSVRFGVNDSRAYAESSQIQPLSHVRLPLSLLAGADAGETKSVLDRALRRLGCAPVQGTEHGPLGEILRQSNRGRILLRAPGWIASSSRSSLWIFREDCPLLCPPIIEKTVIDGEGLVQWMVRLAKREAEDPTIPRGRERIYSLSKEGAMGLYRPGLLTQTGRKAKGLFQELDVPVPLRSCVPLELRGGLLVRICLSWIEERADFFVG